MSEQNSGTSSPQGAVGGETLACMRCGCADGFVVEYGNRREPHAVHSDFWGCIAAMKETITLLRSPAAIERDGALSGDDAAAWRIIRDALVSRATGGEHLSAVEARALTQMQNAFLRPSATPAATETREAVADVEELVAGMVTLREEVAALACAYHEAGDGRINRERWNLLTSVVTMLIKAESEITDRSPTSESAPPVPTRDAAVEACAREIHEFYMGYPPTSRNADPLVLAILKSHGAFTSNMGEVGS